MTNAKLKTASAPSFAEPDVTEALAATFGVKPDEYAHILKILGRVPSYTELGIFSVMWSEHCSYKSSRIHLKKLPTSAPWVIQGPGENAGVIDIGDGQAAVFKMESHNHPSYIEPYQGATTGVGGIMRDVFTMGARPIANLNALRFGAPDHPKTRHLLDGVVAGIAGYGNCMGVPTVGGETQFHASYNGNILVNAMTVGVVDHDKIYYSRGASPDMPVVYVGSKTGRDGIHGATMASAEFDDEAEAQRPTVQVGDPFTEKLLLEACLELMQSDAIVCIQDMGAAGLTSSSVEIADKGNVGVVLDLDQVPMRETGMIPYELMLSESQERMLMIIKPEREADAKAIFDKWDLDFAVIGRTIPEQRLILNMYGRTWCDIPVPPLVNEAPLYDRPTEVYPCAAVLTNTPKSANLLNDLKKLVSSPDMASKRWIWEQYDSLVMGQTVAGPGIGNNQTNKAADAALVRVTGNGCQVSGVGESVHCPPPTVTQYLSPVKALALTSDCNPRYCFADPFEGGKQAVAESYRNICATGATPLAVTNNLNFGNPEKPRIMAQLVQCIEGLAEACRVLDYPVVSGNVSLYDGTSGNAILPTPVIGGVGMIKDWSKAMDMGFKSEGETILLIGSAGTHLGQSLWLKEIFGREEGAPPPVDLAKERKHGEFIRALIDQKLITACHDISDGGLLCALAEMAMAGSGVGCQVTVDGGADFWFGEDQARYVVTTTQADKIAAAGIPVTMIGKTGGDRLNFANEGSITVVDLKHRNESWLPNYMTGKSSS